jgi:hypothetical protein
VGATSPTRWPSGTGSRAASISSSLGRVASGRNQAWAISVGTTALRITTVTRIVYYAWSTMPLLRPNRAEIVPNVRPVLISNVV